MNDKQGKQTLEMTYKYCHNGYPYELLNFVHVWEDSGWINHRLQQNYWPEENMYSEYW